MENKKKYNSFYKFDRIKFFPISLVVICLGLIGFTLAWQKAEQILNLPFIISNYFLYFSIIVMGIIIFIYLIKLIKYPEVVKTEFNHPIKHGSVTIMDLSTSNINEMRKLIIEKSIVPVGTVPIYQAAIESAKNKGIVNMSVESIFDVIEKQAEDGANFMTVHCCGVTKKAFKEISDSDIIGIYTITSNSTRAYELGDFFKSKKKKVIIRGMHATAMPYEALQHADQVIVGEAESVIKDVINGVIKDKIVYAPKIIKPWMILTKK